MHEIGVVEDIISVINAKLHGLNDYSKLISVDIVIGEMEDVNPEDIEFHFREHTKGTPLEESRLNFRKAGIRLRCKKCNFEFSIDSGMDGCPRCKSNVNDVIEGKGVHIASMEVEDKMRKKI